MKYLRSFETKTDYNVAKANGEILKPSVTFVENKLYYESLPVTVAGDIAVYDKVDKKFRFLSYSSYIESYHQDGTLIPIGVVVVPSTHTPDNTSRVMSLVNMSCTSPSTGSTATQLAVVPNHLSMYWGGNGIDLGLKNLEQVVTVDGNLSATDPNDGGVSYSSWAKLPGTDPAWTAIWNTIDIGTRWSSAEDTHGPSPYLSDGSRSKVYLKKENNCLWDFDGKGNTDVIMAAQTVDWSGTITNNSSAGNYPPACCCRRFSTAGTSAGDWYLPAIGELAYLPVRLKEINLTLIALEKYVSAIRVGGINSQWSESTYGYWCWSSSEYSSTQARIVSTGAGSVYETDKSYVSTNIRARAFIAL